MSDGSVLRLPRQQQHGNPLRLVEVNTRDGLGPIHRYVAPFVIASLILLSFYDMWRIAQANAAKKSN